MCSGVSESPVDALGGELALLERELRRDGWETVSTAVTKAEVITHDEGREVWLIHKTPNTQIATAIEGFQDGGLISTCTYQQRRDGCLYELLLLLNPGSEYAILLPTIVERDQLPAASRARGYETNLYSVVTCPTGEQIGAVQHTEPSTLLPDAT